MTCRDAAAGRDGVAAIVLAAGGGTRFRDIGHKLSAVLPTTPNRPREPVATRAIAAAVAAEIGPVVVVTGRLSAHELGLPEPGADTDDSADPPAIITVHNDAWHDGQMTSVRTGLVAARELESEIVVIGLADQPGIEPAAWRAVAAAASPDAPIAVAVYSGQRANPVALHRTVWELLPVGGDEGARSLMRLHPDLVREVPCSGSPSDIDTAEDLRRWQNN